MACVPPLSIFVVMHAIFFDKLIRDEHLGIRACLRPLFVVE
jgi:hypothetical protein